MVRGTRAAQLRPINVAVNSSILSFIICSSFSFGVCRYDYMNKRRQLDVLKELESHAAELQSKREYEYLDDESG